MIISKCLSLRGDRSHCGVQIFFSFVLNDIFKLRQMVFSF